MKVGSWKTAVVVGIPALTLLLLVSWPSVVATGSQGPQRAISSVEQESPTASGVPWRIVGQIGGPTQAVAAQGQFVYIGVGLRLIVLDVTNPLTPTEVGSTASFPCFVEDVVVRGTRAYIAAGGAGLRVVDISDPHNPTELGAWDSPGYAEGVAVGDYGGRMYVFLADGPYGLWTVDVSDPTHPRQIGSAYDMNYAFAVTMSGNRAYIAAAGAGLLIADVADLAHPVEVGALDSPGYAYGVTVSGTLAYVADGWEGVHIVDVSNPSVPRKVSTCKMPGWAFDLTLVGSRVYVAAAFGGLQVLDVSDPAQPHTLGGYETAGGHVGRVSVAGNIAYVADRNRGLRVISVADPSQPSQVSLYNSLSYADGVWVEGDTAYVTAGRDGLQIVDASDPARPIRIGSYDTQAYARSVTVDGNYAYVGAISGGSGNGLHVLHVANPAHPVKVGFLELGPAALDIVVAEGIAYLAAEWGLGLVSVSDPSHPTEVGFIQLWEYVGAPDAVEGVAVSGTLAYVASSWAGLEIVDASNPVSPTLIGAYNSGSSFSQDVAVVGRRVYVADTHGLQVVDVSDPLHPTGLGYADTPGEAYGVVVAGTTAYVACGSGGVAVVDVSDPYSPTLLSAFDTLGYARQVATDGSRIYVADGPNGLLILEPATDDPTTKPEAWPAQSRPRPAHQAIFEQTALRRASVAPGNWLMRPAMPVAPPPISLKPDAPTPGELNHTTGIAATCTVTSTADSGIGTLRWCLGNSANGGIVTFDPTAFPPARSATITLLSSLPWLTQGHITIDASNAGVILDGSSTPSSTTGLVIASDGNTIRGLQMLRFPADGILIFNGAKNNRVGGDRRRGRGPMGEGNLISGNGNNGISIYGSGTMSNTVTGNFIGSDLSGTHIVSNQVGVSIAYGANHNTIGGAAEGQRNVIAGNQNNVTIWGTGSDYNMVTDNLIGTDPSGSFALYASSSPDCCTRGVMIGEGAQHNIVGPRNVINGSYWGIQLFGEGVDENVIIGNLIGTTISGTAAIGNFSDGILISEGPQRNRIGGATPEERNIISGNGGNGISIAGAQTISNTVSGNYVGTDISGTAALGNMGPGGGIQVWSPNNVVGGYLPGEGNLVSSNGSNGISLIGSQAYGNRIIGNYAGTDVSGTMDVGNRGHGIALECGAYGNLVEGNLSSGNSRTGVAVGDWGSNYNVIIGNLIGTDADGARAISNDQGGVSVGWGGASFNRIGGTRRKDRNLISGNDNGVLIGGAGAVGNLLLGNFIGTDTSGTRPLANRHWGIALGGGGGGRSLVGGATVAERNVVSANGGGVELASDFNYVGGNHIGTDAGGTVVLGNAWVAVNVQDAEHNVIQDNLIAYNQSHGFWVHAGAFNAIRRNSIHSNAGQGIILSDGGNNLLPAPVIIAVTETGVSGTACPGCTVEIFSDDADEGRLYEGSVVASIQGTFTFTTADQLEGPYVTATATDSKGNTSQFSAPHLLRPYVIWLPIVLDEG